MRIHKLTTIALLVAASSLLGACEDDVIGSDEVYIADLQPLNADWTDDDVEGEAEFVIDQGIFSAETFVVGVTANVLHPQHIHAGASCPTMDADTNGDGIIDVVEGLPSYGAILVPLDSDLSSQDAGDFPMAPDGEIVYFETTDLDEMLAELREQDPDPDDATIKLGANEDLALGTRHVVIHGISQDVELPDTVQTIDGLPAQVTLPIACGEIRLVETNDDGLLE